MIDLDLALQEEINYLKNLKYRTSYTLYDGVLISRSVEDNADGKTVPVGYYRFKNAQLINLAPDTGALFTVNGKKSRGFIQFCDRFGIEATIEDCDDNILDSVVVEIESWSLLEIQRTRLGKIKTNSIVSKIRKEHSSPSLEMDEFMYGQGNAVEHARKNPITVIWGPPGTGKTYTLAKIALDAMDPGKRVLILSQSNMAVDSAIMQIRRVLESSGSTHLRGNKILRYGMVKSPDLLNYRNLLSWDAAFDSRPELKTKYESLLDELTDAMEKSQTEIRELNSERRKILGQISQIEMTLLSNARIVAMTATKATISKSIYEQNWDVVIFDEISMAYISQILIAASMAKEKLVLVGDFKQLAPIVQNDNPRSILRNDIFSYANIVKGSIPRKHPWLVMLNVQWRMHPEIVEFANSRIYSNKLQTAPDSLAHTASISKRPPFAPNVFAYIDYSGYQGTCFSSKTGSRFNLFSAILTVKTAIEAINGGQTDIGIVTPYAAQSQIINAIIRDIESRENVKLPIYCATVHQFQGSERDVVIFDTVESLPKRESGKIISSEDDSSMRLINVALTRARGKFIIVGNHEYLRLHQSEISPDMWALIQVAKSKCHIRGKDFFDFFLKNVMGDTIRCYSSIESAVEVFKTDMQKCNAKVENRFIEYWHAPRNHFSTQSKYRFSDFLRDALALGNYKRIYTSDNGVDDIVYAYPKLPRNKVRLSGVAPKDDFVFIDDLERQEKILWLNIPAVWNNSTNETRLPYALTGDNIAYQFRKLCDLDYGLKLASDKAKGQNASVGSFGTFINGKLHCSTPGCKKSKGIKLLKSKTGKYYVKCEECGNTISPYIPNDLLEEYVEMNGFRCKTCGYPVEISKYGRPYCTHDYKHDVGFATNDIIEKDPTVIKPKQQATSSVSQESTKPKVVVIKH